jgi:5-methyltetrahydropteroyltriglutamate--homocysteine methyltransferase
MIRVVFGPRDGPKWIRLAEIEAMIEGSDIHRNDLPKIGKTLVEIQAVADIPADRMRMHVCWGSTVAPHHTDVPLKDIIDIVLSAKPMAVSFPAANARHEHEWKIWREVKLPAGKAIVPGVIDSTVNTVEHPEVVADRILNFANVVGRENVIAGVDCGFGTFAGRVQVDTKIVWLKLQSLTEGARLAAAQLWAKAA